MRTQGGHVGGGLSALLQKVLRHDHQRLAVGQARILIAFPQQPLPVMERRRTGLCAGLKAQEQHGRPLLLW